MGCYADAEQPAWHSFALDKCFILWYTWFDIIFWATALLMSFHQCNPCTCISSSSCVILLDMIELTSIWNSLCWQYNLLLYDKNAASGKFALVWFCPPAFTCCNFTSQQQFSTSRNVVGRAWHRNSAAKGDTVWVDYGGMRAQILPRYFRVPHQGPLQVVSSLMTLVASTKQRRWVEMSWFGDRL